MTTIHSPGTAHRQYDYVNEGPRHSRLWAERYILFLQDITAVFDGFKALDIGNLGIGHKELRVVVGPNGAGKTTMCDVISGMTRPTTGKIFFDGKEITRQNETAIAQMGVGRKFQVPKVFDSLTVWENMLLSLPVMETTRPVDLRKADAMETAKWAGHTLAKTARHFFNAGGRETPKAREQIEAILDRVKLIDERHSVAKTLSHGQRQWLAISSLILAKPKLLLVDEPAAGLTDFETTLTAELMLELKDEHTIICIEHDMEFVRRLGSRVTVLNEGRVLAEGTLDEVKENEEVIEVFLGR